MWNNINNAIKLIYLPTFEAIKILRFDYDFFAKNVKRTAFCAILLLLYRLGGSLLGWAHNILS